MTGLLVLYSAEVFQTANSRLLTILLQAFCKVLRRFLKCCDQCIERRLPLASIAWQGGGVLQTPMHTVTLLQPAWAKLPVRLSCTQ